MRKLKPAIVAASEVFGTKIGNYASLKSGNKQFRKKLKGNFYILKFGDEIVQQYLF